MNPLIDFFRVMGSERRFEIFLHLQKHNIAAVCDIADLLEVSEPVASFHLKKLVRIGVVKQNRVGKYTLSSVCIN